MTKKAEVNRESYRKAPRLLGPATEEALKPGGVLHAVLDEVRRDPNLRLDIRDRQFNVYYRGGNLLRLKGTRSPWKADFDSQYFVGDDEALPSRPRTIVTADDADAWIRAFPLLRAGMDAWWGSGNRRKERDDCQRIAAAHPAVEVQARADFIVLDIEYQWAQRRFDLMAARRRITDDDASGWREPDLVFIEVKSAMGPCSGDSGLGAHARDFHDIVDTRDGRALQGIKREYEGVIAQKTRLGLFDDTLGFHRFSDLAANLLVVLIGINPEDPKLRAPLQEVQSVAESLANSECIQLLMLDDAACPLRACSAVPIARFIAAHT